MRHHTTSAPRRPAQNRPRTPRPSWDAQSLALISVFAALLAASAIVPGIPVGSL